MVGLKPNCSSLPWSLLSLGLVACGDGGSDSTTSEADTAPGERIW